MKTVINIKGEPKKDDVLVCIEDGVYMPVPKSSFLGDLQSQIINLTNYCNNLREVCNDLKNGVNIKLKEYHDVLQNLTKGE